MLLEMGRDRKVDETKKGSRAVTKTLVVVAALLSFLLVAPAAAQSIDECTVDIERDGSTVTATPSAQCGPLHLAVYRYADGATGVWSPGDFDFEVTLPQTLADSATGDDVLSVQVPCGFWQADAWLAEGPSIPDRITAEFLGEHYTEILGSMKAGIHGESVCDTEVGSEVVDRNPQNEIDVVSGPGTSGPGTSGPQVAGVSQTRIPRAPSATPAVAEPAYAG